MIPILTIIGFAILYLVARRLARTTRRPQQMGFIQPRKRTWLEKLFRKIFNR